MTAWEIKWCNCLERCRALLDVADLREDTKDYVENVHLAINAYPLKYPTDKQAYWIHTLYRQHCRRPMGKSIAKLTLQAAGW